MTAHHMGLEAQWALHREEGMEKSESWSLATEEAGTTGQQMKEAPW